MIRNACIDRLTDWSIGIMILSGACTQGPCPTSQPAAGAPGGSSCDSVYVGGGDPYADGPLAVQVTRMWRCEDGAPLDLLVFTPEVPGSYAVVVFQHGFLLDNGSYSAILRHLAGHGFAVVAPQMYEAGVAALLGSPTAAEEAACRATRMLSPG